MKDMDRLGLGRGYSGCRPNVSVSKFEEVIARIHG